MKEHVAYKKSIGGGRMNRKWTYIMMCLLILIMPLHYYICELFIKSTSIDNLFRDALIIILLVLYVRKSGLRIKKIGILIFINCAILVMYALISYLLWNYNSTFNILRTYIVPMLFFLLIVDAFHLFLEFIPRSCRARPSMQ